MVGVVGGYVKNLCTDQESLLFYPVSDQLLLTRSGIMPRGDRYELLHVRGRSSRKGWRIVVVLVLGVLVMILAAFGLGIDAGYFLPQSTICRSGSTPSTYLPMVSPPSSLQTSNQTEIEWGSLLYDAQGSLVSVFDEVDGLVKTERIQSNLKTLTKDPHIAGSETNIQLAYFVAKQWEDLGFDKVELFNYTVLLQYPNDTNPNKFQLLDGSGTVFYDAPTAQLEPPLTTDEKKPGVARPFNAYSGVGSARGPLVYVNYGRREDFELLRTMGISVNGCICMARYGNIFRGSKAMMAQQHSCKALVIYSDPADYAVKGGPPPYPKGWSLPSSGLQRGTLQIAEGDSLTPLRPALPGVYRRTYEEALADKAYPSIPVTPLSYGDAYHFLSILSQDHKAPQEWQGQLNITYYIGPGFTAKFKEYTAYVEVNNFLANRTIVNVIGTVYGSQEPDHPVLLGNHRDAWVFGGIDPNSGTASLLEIGHAIGSLRQLGWRPGRTMMLCSWDAEEYSLIGSVEFAEERAKLLSLTAVAYLNVDVATDGTAFIGGHASPLIIPAFYAAAKAVRSPNNASMSIYDEWLQYYPGPDHKPLVEGLGSGSDYVAFLQSLGIASGDLNYNYDHKKLPYASYPVYHSIHDTYYYVKDYGDPSFSHNKALAEVWLKSALHLSTTPVIPFGVVEYGEKLKELAKALNTSVFPALKQQDISLDFLFAAVRDFQEAATLLKNATDYVNRKAFNATTILKKWRVLNTKLLGIERSFLVPEGLPNRPFYKHVVYAPSIYDSYASSAFPGISDAVFEQDWNQVRLQISLASLRLRAAADVMTDALEAAIYG